MTATDALGRLAAGLSMSLTLFAVGLLMTYVKRLPGEIAGLVVENARRLNARAWSLIAFSVLAYRPLHTGWLLGHSAPPLLSRSGELIAVLLANAAFVRVLAARALLIGLPQKRVRSGAIANIATIAGCVVVAWLIP